MNAKNNSISFWKLLVHEMSINWRSLGFSPRMQVVLGLLMTGYVALSFWFAINGIEESIEPTPYFYIMILLGSIAMLTFNLSGAMRATQNSLYEHADLELLLTSPASPQRVIMAKLAGISVSMLTFNVIFVFPLLIPIALIKNPNLLGLPILMIAIAVFATCMGLGLTLLVVRLIGARAARKAIQIVSAVTAASVFIGSQFAVHAGEGEKSGFQSLYDWCLHYGIGATGITSLPGRAGFGDLLALGAIVLSVCIIFVFTSFALQKRFMNSLQTAGNHGSPRKNRNQNIAQHFSNNFGWMIIKKEILLMLRDPALIFNLLLQLIFLIPLILGLAKITSLFMVIPGAAFLSVFGSGKLIGDITGIAITGEDAPDLLTVAPRTAKQILRLKLLAVLIMGGPLMLIIPLLLVTKSPTAALITTLFTAVVAMITAAIELKFSKTSTRRKFSGRKAGSTLANLLNLFVSFFMGGVAAMVVQLLT
jgi:ABC-2 type transport system permease protein